MRGFLYGVAGKLRNWPIIGQPVQILGALMQLPELRDRQRQFEEAQLPSVLAAISDVNHRLLQRDSGDISNLLRSAPVALRRITREVYTLRVNLEELSARHEALEVHQERAAVAQEKAERQRKELLTELNSQIVANAKRTADTNEVLAELGEKLGHLQSAIEAMDGGPSSAVDLLRARVLELSDAIESARLDADYLVNRIEFVRRETLYELRYGASSAEASGAASGLSMAAEVLSPEKLNDYRRRGLRLNLGCGHIPLDGYINVDRRPLPGVDLVSEVNELPFASGELLEIHSAHLLEHFPEEQLRRELLPFWKDLLKPGGEFSAVVPDAESMLAGYSDGKLPYADLRLVTFGGQDYEGDFHFNMFTPESLSDLLQGEGFVDIDVVERGRRNGKCLEFEVRARKPKAI